MYVSSYSLLLNIPPQARSFDLEVSPWAPTRLTSCIFHPGPTEAYEPLRSTLCPAHTPFRDLAAPGSTHKPVLHTRGISRVTYRVVLVRINSQKAAGNSLRHLG